jgi:hypothetical protein
MLKARKISRVDMFPDFIFGALSPKIKSLEIQLSPSKKIYWKILKFLNLTLW